MTALVERDDLAIVNQSQINDVHRDFRIVARFHCVPGLLLDVFGRYRTGAGRGGLRGRLEPERIGIFSFDAEHVAIDDHCVSATKGLRDVGVLAFLQGDFSPDRDHRCFDVALQFYFLIGSSLHITCPPIRCSRFRFCLRRPTWRRATARSHISRAREIYERRRTPPACRVRRCCFDRW